MQELTYIRDTDLNDRNFLLYAAKNYENPHCYEMEEFYNDLSMTLHLRKLFTRYHVNGVLKDRLIINHIISLYNVFTPIAAAKILFFKIEKKYHSYLKTVLVYLGRCPDVIILNGEYYNIKAIPIDKSLLDKLGKENTIEDEE